MKLVFIDTETTGFDPKTCALTQIGFILDIDGQIIGKKIYKVKPWEGCHWEQSAIDKTGITPEIAAGYTDSEEVFKHFNSILEKYISRYDKEDKAFFVAYNASFDNDFMRNWFIRHAKTEKDAQWGNGFGNFFWTPYLDVMQVALIRTLKHRSSFPNFQLGTVCRCLGIDFNDEEAHNALYDIEKTRELFYKLKKPSE